MEKRYAGIGSRKTPPAIQDEMSQIARYLYRHDYTLVTGGAVGADQAFMRTAIRKVVFRPEHANDWSRIVVKKYLNDNARLDKISQYTYNLISRNVQIILGEWGEVPVDFVICWTPNAEIVGGTAYGIRCALDHKIPVYNLCDQQDRSSLKVFLETI